MKSELNTRYSGYTPRSNVHKSEKNSRLPLINGGVLSRGHNNAFLFFGQSEIILITKQEQVLRNNHVLVGIGNSVFSSYRDDDLLSDERDGHSLATQRTRDTREKLDFKKKVAKAASPKKKPARENRPAERDRARTDQRRRATTTAAKVAGEKRIPTSDNGDERY